MSVLNMLRGILGTQMGVVNPYCNYNNMCYGGSSFCNSIFDQYNNIGANMNCSQKTAIWTGFGNMLLSNVFMGATQGMCGLLNQGFNWLGGLFKK